MSDIVEEFERLRERYINRTEQLWDDMKFEFQIEHHLDDPDMDDLDEGHYVPD